MNVGGGPALGRTLVVDDDMRFGQERDEAVGDAQRAGGRARVGAPRDSKRRGARPSSEAA